jgi:hypothetical protein
VRGLPSGGCGDSSPERKFLSDKVYRRNDHGIVGVESFGLQCLGFFSVHNIFGREAWPDGSSRPSPMLAPRAWGGRFLPVSVTVETRQVADYSRQLQLLRGTIER